MLGGGPSGLQSQPKKGNENVNLAERLSAMSLWVDLLMILSKNTSAVPIFIVLAFTMYLLMG
jgi:hypothetical protein